MSCKGARTVRVGLGGAEYDIHIARGLIDSLGAALREVCGCASALIVTDTNVDALYGDRAQKSLEAAGYRAARLALPPGEETKRFENVPRIYGALIGAGVTRGDVLVALGGGVVGDLAGFAAATYLRGIPFVQVPTTLLAQIDSSVGGKVGVDLPEGKNLAGCFWQPRAVFIDPDTLDTLPDRFFRDGVAEALKYGCIEDAALFERLSAQPARGGIMEWIDELIARCCAIKARYVEQDERDTGLRMKLNFGHTLGHAIEQATGYARFTHGEAVAIGMAAIAALGEARGLTRPGTAKAVLDALRAWDLPTGCGDVAIEDILAAIGRDKKNLGRKLTVVLLERIGESFLYETGAEFFAEAGKWLT